MIRRNRALLKTLLIALMYALAPTRRVSQPVTATKREHRGSAQKTALTMTPMRFLAMDLEGFEPPNKRL